MTDLISRADAIEALGKLLVDGQTARVDGKFVPLQLNDPPKMEGRMTDAIEGGE